MNHFDISRFKWLMENQGYNPETLAIHTGISENMISDLLEGKETNPQLNAICRLATALGVGTGALIIQFDEDDPRYYETQPLVANINGDGSVSPGYQISRDGHLNFILERDFLNAEWSGKAGEGSQDDEYYIRIKLSVCNYPFPVLKGGFYDRRP